MGVLFFSDGKGEQVTTCLFSGKQGKGRGIPNTSRGVSPPGKSPEGTSSEKLCCTQFFWSFGLSEKLKGFCMFENRYQNSKHTFPTYVAKTRASLCHRVRKESDMMKIISASGCDLILKVNQHFGKSLTQKLSIHHCNIMGIYGRSSPVTHSYRDRGIREEF